MPGAAGEKTAAQAPIRQSSRKKTRARMAPVAHGPLGYGRIFRMWLPMAATWFMMSMEGLLIAVLVGRLPDSTVNLAAYGVAFAFALIIESPIIMLLSASTALCSDRQAFHALRRFGTALNLGITALVVVAVLSPLYPWVARDLMQLEPQVAELSRLALIVLIPWPAAIGYRRFYQGILIRNGHTRRVAYGTFVRFAGMAITALFLAGTEIPGALVGSAALSVAVLAEAVATRMMVAGGLKRVLATPHEGDPLTTGQILHFYVPLLISSVIALAVHPLVNLFLGHSRLALESLATYPVVAALSFVFRSMGLSFQEVAIATMDGTRERLRPLVRFAVVLGLVASAAQALLAFTPLAGLWFGAVNGLEGDLVELSVRAFQVLIVMPLASVLLAFFRALMVWAGETRAITWAGVIETAAVAGILWLLIEPWGMIGVFAASWAILVSRFVDLVALYRWAVPVVRRLA